jgi:hypothetical protein
VTGTDIPSSDIRDGYGDNVPLVRIAQYKLFSQQLLHPAHNILKLRDK